MGDTTFSGASGKRKLQIADQSIDIDAELKRFEEEERKRLGLDTQTEQWIEDMVGLGFTQSQRSKITLLIGGLTLAHDYLIEGGLKGIGYTVQMLDAPTTEGFQAGKEFGNRGQCNPTYFTVGNLVQYLITLRDKHGMTAKEIVDKYVFLTAGACGPCRFGMYVTEYRKALRDAGFDGFRVMLFQQTGGLKQATGEASGLELGPAVLLGHPEGHVRGRRHQRAQLPHSPVRSRSGRHGPCARRSQAHLLRSARAQDEHHERGLEVQAALPERQGRSHDRKAQGLHHR